jgi:hypothetical protein
MVLAARTPHVSAPTDEPDMVKSMVDPLYNHGPFRLVHLDFQILNLISGLVDWSGCQTVPFRVLRRTSGQDYP